LTRVHRWKSEEAEQSSAAKERKEHKERIDFARHQRIDGCAAIKALN
jgi:hypothetical protein